MIVNEYVKDSSGNIIHQMVEPLATIFLYINPNIHLYTI